MAENYPKGAGDKPIALEAREAAEDARLFSPSAARNRDVIADVAARLLPKSAKVIEIGCGTGEHAAAIVTARPDLSWLPTDLDAASRASAQAHAAALSLTQIAPAIALDARAEEWGVEEQTPFDGLVCCNVIHIAPWEVALGVIAGAQRLLRPGGVLYFYGPFKRGGEHTAPSNAAFDESLRSRDPSWGVRDLDEVQREAEARDLRLREVVEMPANNLSVIFERA